MITAQLGDATGFDRSEQIPHLALIAFRLVGRLDDVGFIHAGFEHQVATVGAILYRDAPGPLVVLVIDTERLDAPVVVENLEGGAEGFPHVYGPLPVHTVVDVRPAHLTSGGQFVVADPPHRPSSSP